MLKRRSCSLSFTKLWDAEMQTGSRVLQLATLQRLGGSEKIVQDHVAAEMRRISDHERNLSANIFRFLVMPAGGRDRATHRRSGRGRGPASEEVVPLLEKLASVRILSRSYPPERYEIFHDVLAPAVLDWRAKHQKAQERAAAELRAEIEARSARRFRSLAIALAVMFVLAVAAGIVAHERAMESRSRELQPPRFLNCQRTRNAASSSRCMVFGKNTLGKRKRHCTGPLWPLGSGERSEPANVQCFRWRPARMARTLRRHARTAR